MYIAKKYITQYKSRSVSILLSMIICIGLIVGISSLFESEKQANIDMLKYEFGIHDAKLVKVDSNIEQKLINNKNIKKVGLTKYYDSNADLNKEFNIVEANSDFLDLNNTKIVKGKFPTKSGEIAIEPWVAQNLGLSENLNQKVKFKLYNSQKEEEFTVVGILKDRVSNKAKGFQELIIPLNNKNTKEETAYIEFNDKKNINEQINNLKKELKISSDKIKSNQYVLEAQNQNIFINANLSVVIFIVAVFACVIVYSIFNISTLQRLSEYGMFKAIGAKNRQMFNMIFSELFVLFLVSIPCGVLTGFVGANLASSKVGQLGVESAGASISKVFISKESIIIAIILLLIDIIIIALVNTIKLKRKSAIDCIYLDFDFNKKNSKYTYNIGRKLYVTKFISIKNLLKDKKSLLITVISMALGSTIFIVSNFSTSIQKESNRLHYQSNGEFTSDYKISETSSNLRAGLTKNQIKNLENLDGVKSVEAFKYNFVSMNVKDEDAHYPHFYDDLNNGGRTKNLYGGIFTRNIDNKSYDYKGSLFGYNDTSLNKLKPFLTEGNIDIDSMKKNNICILKVDYDGFKNKILDYKPGDKIKVKYLKSSIMSEETLKFPEDREYIEKEYVIGALVEDGIVREEYTGGSFGCQVILANEEFERDLGFENYWIVNIDKKPNYSSSKLNKKIHNTTKETLGLLMRDLSEEMNKLDEYSNTKAMFINAITIILFLVSLFNIINSISYSLISRVNEFGILRSMGMTLKRLKNMINFEGIGYGVIANVVTIVLSLVLQMIIFDKMKGNLMNPKFYIDYNLYIAVVISNMIIGFLATYIPSYKFKKKDIMDLIVKIE
jgi:putative ABC transport system permease protein